ncbi:hypothetical protein KFE98_14170 [bacterium SCSIO 12741]|nr:hypothetical protein KFE98_14170 [bacterium SCSIO 12741]
MTTNDVKVCQECGTEIRGRADKKYCDDSCRNAWFNRHNRTTGNYMRKVNRILKNNRRILEELNPKGTSKSTRKVLHREGFNFDFYTNIYRTKTGKEYHFCYEQGYLDIGNGHYALVLKKDYIE